MLSTLCSTLCSTRIVVRAASVAAFGALVGLPLAAPAPATDAAGVTFTNGGLSCGSKPDISRIKVITGQKVRLTNQLGLDATVKIDGSVSTTVTDGETVEVQFQRGPVTIVMVHDCAPDLNPSYEPLTVVVTQNATTRSPHPTPANSPKPSSARGNGSPSGGRDGSPPGDAQFTEATVRGLDPPGGVSVGMAATVVHLERSPRGQTLAGDTGEADKGPIGFLTIIATVCVFAVSAGATYAIITQRPTRTGLA